MAASTAICSAYTRDAATTATAPRGIIKRFMSPFLRGVPLPFPRT